MRPVRLELEGFTSFRQPCAIDFAGLDLFAITGPTGAGKTTLIDSMLFALYGRTPRIGQGLADLISHGAAEMKVLLEFRVGAERYRAFRQVKRKGAGKQRLDHLADGDEWVTIADKSTRMDQEAQRILGLDFDGFTKTVVLPQGEFDRFLRGEAKKRRAILIELLGLDMYAQMMRKANENAGSDAARAKLIEDHVAKQLQDLSPETVAAWEEEAAKAREQAEEVREMLDRLEQAIPLQARLQEVLQLRRERERLSAELAPMADRLRGLEVELQTADAEVDAAREECEKFDALGSPDLLRRQAEDIRKAVRRRADIAKHREILERLKVETETATAAVQQAEAAFEAAKANVFEAVKAGAADQLREHLHAGDECPVCEQMVLLVPAAKSNATVAEAQVAEKAAAKAYEAARQKQATVAGNLKLTHQQIKSWEQDLVDADGDPEALEEAAAKSEAARVALRRVEAKAAASRKALEQVRQQSSAAEAKLAVMEERLAGAPDPIELEAQLGPWTGRDLAAERKQFLGALQALERTVARREVEIATAAKTMEESNSKRAEARELQRTAEVARRLGTLLQENRFQTFVLGRTLHRLAVEGTRQLMHLSSNRYGFSTDEDEFLVVDHWNADEKRSVNTLSGGESFLASLSLALALSKSLPDFAVNRDAVALDSLFLDEGFSTLDNETMQVVLDAIELLRADGRMIGVISHVSELAERLPAKIEVQKSPGGSTVTVKA
jgi:exonuclease SbcC